MPYPDTWRFKIRPQIYEEAAGEVAPSSLEHQGWTLLHKKDVVGNWSPNWTLTEDTKIGGTISNQSIRDERLVSREFKIKNYDFTLLFDVKVVTANDGSCSFSLLHTPAFSIAAAVGEFANSIRMRFTSNTTTGFVELRASDSLTDATPSTTLDIGLVERFCKLERTGNNVKLTVYTDAGRTTELGNRSIDISTLKIANLKYMQFSNFPNDTVSPFITIQIEFDSIKLAMKDYIDITQDSVSKLMDFSFSMTKNRTKNLQMSFDNSEDELSDLESGDEILAWFDNEAKGLVLSLDMERKDINGNIIDFSGNNFIGTLTGTNVKDGKVEKALEFTSSGTDKIVFANNSKFSFSTSFTICAWVNPTNFSIARAILSKALTFAAYQLVITTSGNVRLVIGDGTANNIFTSTAALTAATWTHIAAVFDDTANKVFLYFNGKEDSSFTYTGVIAQNTTNLFIGTDIDSLLDFLGFIDEVALYDRALTSSEIRDYYDRAGRCPKLYFQGLIEDIDKRNERINISSIATNELTGIELFDLIVEGQTLIATKGGTADKIGYRFGFSDLLIAGTPDFQFYTPLKDSDGNDITLSTASIENIFIAKNTGYVSNSGHLGDESVGLHLDNTPNRDIAISFTAQSTRIDTLKLFIDWDLTNFDTQRLIVDIRKNEASSATAPDNRPSSTVVATKTFTFPADNINTLVTLDLSNATWNEDLTPSSTYWILFSIDFDSARATATPPYLLIRERYASYVNEYNLYSIDGTTENWTNKTLFCAMLYKDFEETIEELNETNFFIVYNTTLGKWIAELSGPRVEKSIINTGNNYSTIPDFIIAGLYYSKKSMLIKHVIERILRKTRKLKGTYSGRVSTQNLGFYFAQGGTLQENIQKLADKSNSSISNKIGNYLFIEDSKERSTLINGAMEQNIGWSFKISAGSFGTDNGYTGTAKTGTLAYKITIPSTTTAGTIEIFQDIDNWNGDVSVWVKTDTTDTDWTMKIEKEDFGGGGTRSTVASATASTTYTRLSGSVSVTKFRLIISLSKVVTGVAETNVMHIDDVYQGPVYYGFRHGFDSKVGQDPLQEEFIDISNITREGETDRLVNLGVRLAQGTSIGSVPILAAKSIKIYDKFGPKVAFRKGGNTRKTEDMYKDAQGMVNVNFEESIVFNMTGQAAFLFDQPIYVLNSDVDLNEWRYYVVDDIVIGPHTTKISSVEIETLDVRFLQNLKEKEEEDIAVSDDLPRNMQYFIISDCQLATGSQVGTITDAQITDGTNTFISKKYTTPDDGVHIFEFKKSDAPTTFLANQYMNSLDIRNATADTIGSARFSFGDRFVKTKNMNLAIILFERRKLLGIT